MIKEAYCSFETAKLLKEKGFDGKCRYYYPNDHTQLISYVDCVQSQMFGNDACIAPTHQMAMKWLREKGIYITIVYGDYPSLSKVFWTPQIDSLEGFDLPDSFYKDYDMYEEAVEAALKYSLENLI